MDKVAGDERIKEAVRGAYGAVARRYLEDPPRTACCCRSCSRPQTTAENKVALADSYMAEEDLTGPPRGVSSVADLRPGEVVLDLGSGGGVDCLRAARRVGPEGRVIGLDMTPEMIKLARRRAKEAGLTNVGFRYGEIEDIPLPDGSVDVIISNCVINLSTDKDAVFREAARVLRPGGRLIVSDIVAECELPHAIRGSLAAWAGCVAGADEESDYQGRIWAAGFEEVEILSREYVEARATLARAGFPPHALDDTLVSVVIKAHKPA